MTQEEALAILKTGANVFLTGEPGSGKTHTINRYVAWLREHGIKRAITASTGIAATHIGGMTIHSWSGIGVRRTLSQRDLHTIMANRRVAKRIENSAVLIIDEISMLAAETLVLIETVCRQVRGKNKPFGGLQVVFVGDFFQLPPIVQRPVVSGIEPEMRLGFGEHAMNTLAPYAFRSPAWTAANLTTCYLSEQYRQEDKTFLKVLAAVRSGIPDAFVQATLGMRRVAESGVPRDLPKLYAHNSDVDRVNVERLAAIPGSPRKFEMTGHGPEALVATVKRGCLSPETLTLKIGARVMFTKNDPEGSFVNGTLGEVETFTDPGSAGIPGTGNPVVRTLKGRRIYVEPMEWTIVDGTRTLARITQMPLRLAWALTIHKSQGMTLDAAVMDLTQTFEYGQGYVALSRVRALTGLHLLGWNTRALEVHPEILAEDKNFKLRSSEAQKTLLTLPAEREKRTRDFIIACGGTLSRAYMGSGDTVERVAVSGRSNDAAGGSTRDITLTLFKAGKSLAQIAQTRGLVTATIFSHIADLYATGRISREELKPLVTPALQHVLPVIHAAFKELGGERLSPVFEKLRGAHSYDDLRLARMLME